LLDGINLDSFVERFGPMPPARVVHVLCQACDSLGEAHAHGLIHRDVKPANIHLCRMGLQHDYVKVLDFGIVKSQRRPVPELARRLEACALPQQWTERQAQEWWRDHMPAAAGAAWEAGVSGDRSAFASTV